MQNIWQHIYAAFIEADRWKLYLKGLGVTLEVSFFAALLGILIGTIAAFLKLSTRKNGSKTIASRIASAYIDIIRGTPTTVQLLIMWSGILATCKNSVLIASLISGQSYTVAGSYYVNLSMFFAFAFLFPDTQVLLFFIVPIKMKWLAYLDAALFAVDVVRSLLAGNWGGALLPVIALLNFAVFIWPEVHYMADRAAYRHRPQTVQFKRAAQQQQKQEQQQGYHHKCAVCGRTDTDYPDLQFRYCSKCAGYHCFCQDHIFTHVHFTE